MIDISLEGCIGAGKSFLLNHLREHLGLSDVVFVDEPVQQWDKYRDGKGNILQHFYADQTLWSFTFQWTCMITRHNAMLESPHCSDPNALLFQERSVGADGNVFARLLHENGHMSDIEWSVYTEWYDRLAEMLNVRSQAMVYMRVSPETALKRIQQRGRMGEESITLEYLKQVCDKHEEWMVRNAQPTLILEEGTPLDVCTDAIRSFILDQQAKRNSPQ